jgi:hypothetical protein
MKTRNDVSKLVIKCGGRLVDAGSSQYDGKVYAYAARFDDDEQVDLFVNKANCSKTDRDILDGYLTLFFSV